MADAEVRRRLASEQVQDWIHGWQLMVLTAPDSELPGLLRESFSVGVLPTFPNASVWAVTVDPRYHWRFALVRVLFGALEAPELLDRSAEKFKGFAAGRELSSNTFFGLDSLPYLRIPHRAVPAPCQAGSTTNRIVVKPLSAE